MTGPIKEGFPVVETLSVSNCSIAMSCHDKLQHKENIAGRLEAGESQYSIDFGIRNNSMVRHVTDLVLHQQDCKSYLTRQCGTTFVRQVSESRRPTMQSCCLGSIINNINCDVSSVKHAECGLTGDGELFGSVKIYAASS